MSRSGNTGENVEENGASVCPKCGAPVIHGYGLMGGGMGMYSLCDNDACDFFEKTQDGDE